MNGHLDELNLVELEALDHVEAEALNNGEVKKLDQIEVDALDQEELAALKVAEPVNSVGDGDGGDNPERVDLGEESYEDFGFLKHILFGFMLKSYEKKCYKGYLKAVYLSNLVFE